ncbi:AraC family transcriptional regulator [Streptomyces sp. NBC_01803]|uniref:AraC family transcriptional regulator n=1 Tax=Streptomyces sp. NBC_01803 TaxID=2975946 RepID=UPI002DDA7B37|nr:AraC family transcriptional regulator [Streptomyces sp. NBC_01803]WSA46322.1 AraC family transcriptional regulator [Streptomyces sp. NBC_01803]
MDALTSLLDGPRARGAFLMRVVLTPPWAVEVRDEAPLTLVCAARGGAVIARGGGETWLAAGDVAVIRGPEPYVVGDDPATEPQAQIRPGGCSVGRDGTDLCEAFDLGVRTWGTAPDGPTELLIGTYQLHREVSGRLLRALPPVLLLRAGEWHSPLLTLLGAEMIRDEPGQEVVLDRVLDLLLISVLRAWFARPEAAAPAWYRAHGDPVVGRALRLIHDHPAHSWTVSSLAAKAGVSRAALARRFTGLVGEPPMTYLTGLRLEMAAELLREPHATVEAVARRVGYGSPFALSTAFKRERGVSPSEYRDRAGAEASQSSVGPGSGR